MPHDAPPARADIQKPWFGMLSLRAGMLSREISVSLGVVADRLCEFRTGARHPLTDLGRFAPYWQCPRFLRRPFDAGWGEFLRQPQYKCDWYGIARDPEREHTPFRTRWRTASCGLCACGWAIHTSGGDLLTEEAATPSAR
jgi:hypothetical protein